MVIVFTNCATNNVGNKGFSLLEAIEQSAKKIAEELPVDSRVAIVAFKSENTNLSDYIMEELNGALFDRDIEVADRQNLEYIYKELGFQMSGEVSDESAVSIGKFLGAQLVISGQLTNVGGIYRYMVSAIDVEKAVRTSVSRFNVRNDQSMKRIVIDFAKQETTINNNVISTQYSVNEQIVLKSAGTFLDRGIFFASRGDYEMAIMSFNEAIQLSPVFSAAYLLRGRVLYASVSNLISIENNFSGISSRLNYYVITSEQNEVYEQAIADFNHALILDPNNGKIYSERGRVYSEWRDFDKAFEDHNKAINLNPNDASSYTMRGDTFIYRYFSPYDDDLRSDYVNAINDYTKAIQLDPNYLPVYIKRAEAYILSDDNIDVAFEDFSKAIVLDPSNGELYFNRGYWNWRNDIELMIDDFSKAISLNFNLPWSYYYRGSAYSRKYSSPGYNYQDSDFEKAIADFTQAIRLNPNIARFFFSRGNLYAERGEYYYIRSLGYSAIREFDRAIVDFDTVLHIDPNFTDAKKNNEQAKRYIESIKREQ